MRFYGIIFFSIFLLARLDCYGEDPVILVTGGAGYIGSHTCKALKEAGFIPVSYDSLSAGMEESVKWGPLVVGDLLDREKLESVFLKYRPVAVIHFAALRNVGESVQDPSSYYSTNVAGSINLLNAMLKHGVKEIIFSSSCTVYGNCNSDAIDENYARAPTNPYAMSKYIVEKMIEDFSAAYQFKYVILRYFNAAGIEMESGLRRAVHSQSFLIPKALLSLLHPDSPLKLFGNDYPTQDGTAIRDYIHVKDLARAHVLSLRHLREGKSSETINLGSGKGYSVLEILDSIQKVTHKTVPFVMAPRREGDVPQAIANTKKAKRILGFETTFSDLDAIIESEWLTMIRSSGVDFKRPVELLDEEKTDHLVREGEGR